MTTTNATVGNGRAVHATYEYRGLTRVVCGANAPGANYAGSRRESRLGFTASSVTCKRCITLGDS